MKKESKNTEISNKNQIYEKKPWFFWEDKKFKKYKLEEYNKIPSFIITIILSILSVTLIVGIISLSIENTINTFNPSSIGEFCGWFIGILLVSIIASHFIFRHINIDSERIKIEKKELKLKKQHQPKLKKS